MLHPYTQAINPVDYLVKDTGDIFPDEDEGFLADLGGKSPNEIHKHASLLKNINAGISPLLRLRFPQLVPRMD